MVSYDVSSLLMNVPLEETVQLLTNKAFIDNWFDETQHLNPNELILVDLVRVAAKTNFSCLTAIYMDKQTELRWAPPLVLY